MKRVWMILVVTVAAFLTGCDGMIDSGPDRARRVKNELNYLSRQFWDDSDYFWLAERPSELTEWHVRDAD